LLHRRRGEDAVGTDAHHPHVVATEDGADAGVVLHLRVPAREHALERVLDADVERREAQEHGDDEVRHHDGERVADEPAGEGVHAEGADYIDPPHPGARCSTRGWWVSLRSWCASGSGE